MAVTESLIITRKSNRYAEKAKLAKITPITPPTSIPTTKTPRGGSLLADSLVYTDYDGTVMNKAQFLADLKDPSYRATMIANQNVKVYPYQNVAIVVGNYHTKGTYKRKPFEHFGRFTDTWIYRDSKWQCVASHTNLIKKGAEF